jgi:hypothetical protein
MNAMMSAINNSNDYEHSARRHQEIEFTLAAVANAIASGKLPPADACAWARIAACAAKALAVAEESTTLNVSLAASCN